MRDSITPTQSSLGDIPDISISREKIISIDTQILALLEERMLVAGDIATYKLAHGKLIYDPVREAALLAEYRSRATFDVSPIFQAIMDVSKQIQESKMK